MRELDPEHLKELQTDFSSAEDFDIDKDEIVLYQDMSYHTGIAYLDVETLTKDLAEKIDIESNIDRK